MKTYLDNVTEEIIRQIKWAGIDNQVDRDIFIDKIIEFCQKIKKKPFKLPKSRKTRHG